MTTQTQAVQNQAPTKGTLISAMFLVGGACIGGGMLALPVATSVSGFFPSIVMMLICWVAMTLSGLLLLEVSLWMNAGEHMISMSSRFLGPIGKWASWILYSFMCYASLVAYTAEGSGQFISAIQAMTNITLSKNVAALLFVLIFGIMIDFGARLVGKINAILFIGMIVAYICLIGLSISEIHETLLRHHNWSTVLISVPLLLTSFSYQTIVPSLTPYLRGYAPYLRWAIMGGTTISLIVYLLWEWIVLGIIPVNGEDGLLAALQAGTAATPYLTKHVGSYWIPLAASYFAFFALVTSFLGFGLGLFDFLADGLKIKKRGWGKIFLGLLIALPVLFFVTQFERVFLLALDFSGGFGDTILSGIMPVLMVWVGRYRYKIVGSYRVWGGKLLLLIVLLFFSGALLQKICFDIGIFPSLQHLLTMETP